MLHDRLLLALPRRDRLGATLSFDSRAGLGISGQPHDVGAISIAIVAGVSISHPIEHLLRSTFLEQMKYSSGSEGYGDAPRSKGSEAAKASSEEGKPALLGHEVTALASAARNGSPPPRRSSDDQELRRFASSADFVNTFCLVITALGFLNAFVSGTRGALLGAAARAIHHLTMLAVRWRLRPEYCPDAARAYRIWNIFVPSVTCVVCLVLGVAQRYGPISTGLREMSGWTTSAMLGLNMLFLRMISVGTVGRAAILFTFGATSFFSLTVHPFSALGSTVEPVLMTAFPLLAELVGHFLFERDHAKQRDDVRAEDGAAAVAEDINPHNFQTLGLIGQGQSSSVFLVRRADDGSLFAMKRILKRGISKRQMYLLGMELEVLRRLSHPFAIKLEHFFETANAKYITMTYAGAGDLVRWAEGMSHSSVRHLACEVLLGIKYLHQMNIMYRDLKPENTLIGNDGHVLLADFGVSKLLEQQTLETSPPRPLVSTFTQVGTLEYMSPEQFDGAEYSYEVDYWALAVMLHELLTQYTIGPRTEPRIATDLLEEEEANLLCQMLLVERTARLGYGEKGAADIQAHPYFEGTDWDAVLAKRALRHSLCCARRWIGTQPRHANQQRLRMPRSFGDVGRETRVRSRNEGKESPQRREGSAGSERGGDPIHAIRSNRFTEYDQWTPDRTCASCEVELSRALTIIQHNVTNRPYKL